MIKIVVCLANKHMNISHTWRRQRKKTLQEEFKKNVFNISEKCFFSVAQHSDIKNMC